MSQGTLYRFVSKIILRCLKKKTNKDDLVYRWWRMNRKVNSPDEWAQVPKTSDLVLFYRFYGLILAGRSADEAAHSLGKHKSYIFRRIDKLEEHLGLLRDDDRLLDRQQGRIIRRTEAGDAMHRKVLKLLQFANTLSENRNEMLVIGATNFVITYLLPGIFVADARFFEDFPRVDLTFQEGEWWDLLAGVKTATMEFAIGPAVPPSSEYETEPLLDMRRTLIFHRGHRRLASPKGKPAFRLEQLAEETLFVLPDSVQPDFPMHKIPKPTAGKGRRIVLPNYAEMRVWVRQGLGVAIHHDRGVLPDDSGTVQSIDLSGELGTTPVYMYFRRGKTNSLHSKAANRFCELVRARLGS